MSRRYIQPIILRPSVLSTTVKGSGKPMNRRLVQALTVIGWAFAILWYVAMGSLLLITLLGVTGIWGIWFPR